MAETTTLADYTRAKRGESKPLPDSPGYWVWSDSSESESVEAIDRDGDGDLVWHPTGRPVSECDSGEYYGPFALTRLEAIRQFTAEIKRLRALCGDAADEQDAAECEGYGALSRDTYNRLRAASKGEQ